MNHKISIIMGIYDCEDTLSEAIDSIIKQTYSNWELIMCDDGSHDNTYEVAKKFQKQFPDKIILLHNDHNIGLNKTLNRCLEYASGEYIARMDGDDLSLKDRFENEVKILDEFEDIAIVSCPMIYFDKNGDWGEGSAIEYPSNSDFIKGTPFCHAPCMVRKEAYMAVKGYSTSKWTMRAEDYHLWFKMYAIGYKGYNLQTAYYKMRDDEKAYNRRRFKYCINEVYVRFSGYRMLNIPIKYYVYVLRPIVVGLLPKKIYMYFHHKKKN